MPRLADVAIDLSPLRTSRDFRRLWTAVTVSGLGSRMTTVAVPYEVYRITDSTLAVGLIAALAFPPLLILSVVGGAIADTVDRRRLVLLTQSAGSGVALLLALNSAVPPTRLWALYVLYTLSVCVHAVALPAQRSVAPLVLERDQIPAAAALTSTAGSFSWVLGPAIGGLLIAVAGAEAAFIGDAISFVVAAALIRGLRALPPSRQGDRFGFGTIAEGLRELRGRTALLGSFLADLNAMVFGMPTALFPALVALRYDDRPSMLGLLYAAPFVGAFLASVTSGWSAAIHRHGVAILICVAVWGTAIAVVGVTEPLWATLALLAVAGGADLVSGIFRQSILQMSTPPHLLGRMEGVGLAVWTTGPALGDLEAGTVAAVTSVETSIVVGGVACVAGVALMAATLPGLVAYDSRQPPIRDLEPPVERRTGST